MNCFHFKMGNSTKVFNFFKFSMSLTDPSFFGMEKIGETNSPGSCSHSTIIPFDNKLSVSLFINPL